MNDLSFSHAVNNRKNAAIAVSDLKQNMTIFCFDFKSCTIKVVPCKKNLVNSYKAIIIDTFLMGESTNFIDASPYLNVDSGSAKSVITPEVFMNILTMKKQMLTDNLGLHFDIFYVAYIASLVIPNQPVITMCNMETGDSSLLLGDKDDFNATASKYNHEKEEMTDFYRDWIGGLSFMNGHIVAELDRQRNTTGFGGASIIPLEFITDWLPADETNPNTVALRALQ
jgi:hypothetical protein